MNRSGIPSTRLFVDAPLGAPTLGIDADRAHYLGRVLRCREGQQLVVFNGQGEERIARIESLARRNPWLRLGEAVEPVPESTARIVLLQALVKSDAMDLIVQKATELGVATVLAVRSEFSVVRLDEERQLRRLEHWRRITLSACEQSGRHRPPDIELCRSLDEAIALLPQGCTRIAFDPRAATSLASNEFGGAVCIAIGPEGGFSPVEADALAASGFVLCTLGPRILRAETAAIAACTAVQVLHGDLA